MKVLQIIDNINVGGAERVMINLSNWLYEKGITIEVAIISGTELELLPLLNPSIKIHYIHRLNKYSIKHMYRLSKLLHSCDIAHIHMRHNYRYCAIASFSSPLRMGKLILHDHSSSNSVLFGLSDFFRPKYYIGTSEFSLSYAKNNLNVKDHIYLLNNSIEKITNVDNPNKKNIILVSNIKPSKNHTFALELIPHTSEDLHIYGAIQDPKYAKRLYQLANEHPENKILFNHFQTDVQVVLNKYKMGIHTSSMETGPLVVVEYLAQRLPFLSYKTGEASTIISKYFPEFFIANFDKYEWIGRIQELLQYSPDFEKMDYVFSKHFSKQSYLSKCLKIYSDVLTS